MNQKMSARLGITSNLAAVSDMPDVARQRVAVGDLFEIVLPLTKAAKEAKAR